MKLLQNQARSAPDILENVVFRYKEGATAESPKSADITEKV
jgi:hypothetical protein